LVGGVTALQLRFVPVLVVPEADRPDGAEGDAEQVPPLPQAPWLVHGWPLPDPPLLVDGFWFWVQKLAT